MHRMLNRSNASSLPKLVVVINVQEVPSNRIAANEYVDHPTNISKKNKLEQKYVDILNDVSESVLNTVIHYGFTPVVHWQSKKSYTYYVKCTPNSDNEEVAYSFELEFRIADHKEDSSTHDSPKLVIKSFNLGEKQFNGYSGLLDAVEHICKELKSGNESVLLEYTGVKVDF